MKIERLLRSRFYRSVVMTDAFKTLRDMGNGHPEEVPGIHIAFKMYPRGGVNSEETSRVVMLPREDALEVARDVIRLHARSEPSAVSGQLVADHVGFHAMSEAEALMIEAVMLWDDPDLRVAFWQALRNVESTQILLKHFVEDQFRFQESAISELGYLKGE